MNFTLILIALFTLLPLQEEDLGSLAGMSESDAASVQDGEILEPSSPQFRKLLYRTGTVDPLVLRQWADRSELIKIEELTANPADFRFHPFAKEALVQSIDRYEYSEKDARNFLSGFYVARCKTPEGEPFVLVSRSSVSSWPLGKPLLEEQRIQFAGFFFGKLKVQNTGQSQPETAPVFFARRFAWYPDSENEALQLDAAKIALAKAGVDISLLDIVKSQKAKPIGNREAICFWQMLAACRDPLSREVNNPIDFATMLRKPIDSVGKAASVQGRVRQCVPVKVTEQDAIGLLGSDTWYQLTIFPDLDGRPIEVGTREGEPEVYKNAFPVTVCTTKLPPGFDSESVVGNIFLCNGYFYRIWTYPSERTENSSLNGQPSPLMMSATMIEVESTKGQLQSFMSAVLMAMAIAVAFIGWYVFRSRKATRSRQDLPEKIEAW